ncbi:MAG: helix-turn-helix domain-containing protein [Clostridium sp.]|uniref:helix-turn-helix domain-containing protein n=1 Tax=Clostridium sp. TaxID=1506 RepID=UPI003F33DDEA
MDNKEVGLRIKNKRNELKLTLKDVADIVGVASSTIQRYENGSITQLKLPVLEAIAKALNINPNWFIFENSTSDLLVCDTMPFTGIKNLIKFKREELGLTYEQLGDLVGVGKSTIRKWETGMIKNIKCNNIIALAKALGVSPALLMDLYLENNTVEPSNKFNLKEKQLLDDFNKLNDLGKKNVLNYTNDLTHMSKYKVYK